eukprot:TRINITY_DN13739_c0_g1_i1.p1 TRINITY_DN13739_c0_g1~~TRINITY_DN13739_c0_g1_i1.p1  ORF type:complete len:316 (-),score=61.55 TRINITY_DN13739_c0_g1_i1:106-1053(-)
MAARSGKREEVLCLLLSALYDQLANYTFNDQIYELNVFLGKFIKELFNSEKPKEIPERYLKVLSADIYGTVYNKKNKDNFISKVSDVLHEDVATVDAEELISILEASLPFKLVIIRQISLKPREFFLSIKSDINKAGADKETPFSACLFMGSSPYLLYTRSQCKSNFGLESVSKESVEKCGIEVPEGWSNYEKRFPTNTVEWFCCKKFSLELNDAFRKKFYQVLNDDKEESSRAAYKSMGQANEVVYLELNKLADYYIQLGNTRELDTNSYGKIQENIKECHKNIKMAFKIHKSKLEDKEAGGQVFTAKFKGILE